jgi:hypothetical protein
MKNGLKILVYAAAVLSTVPLSRPALASNHALTAFSAVIEDLNSTNWFSHAAGDPILKTTCTRSRGLATLFQTDPFAAGGRTAPERTDPFVGKGSTRSLSNGSEHGREGEGERGSERHLRRH